MFDQNSTLHISEECQCQEVVVVTLIRAAKGWWAGTADNVCFPGELKLGKKINRDVASVPAPSPLLPQGPAL